MTHVTEHHAEEEGEGYYGEDSWIGLQIARNTICVNDLLVDARELVRLDVCGPSNVVLFVS